jgi:lysophospholipid acyltransferase (LPLAT)-like uncharacterized protein
MIDPEVVPQTHPKPKRKKTLFSRLTESWLFVTVVALCLRFFLATLSLTFRFRYEGVAELKSFLKENKEAKLIFALWHDRIFLLATALKKTVPHLQFSILMSKSRDGAIPAAFAHSFKQAQTIRSGSTSRHGALADLFKALQQNRAVVMTPDGPRGPRYEAKPGISFLAEKTGAYIVPFSWRASSEKQLNTWDRFCLPLPFSTVTISFGKPFQIKEMPPEEAKRVVEKALSQEVLGQEVLGQQVPDQK